MLKLMRQQLAAVKSSLANVKQLPELSGVHWYPYDTLGTIGLLLDNLPTLEGILKTPCAKIAADIGTGDGATAFFLERMGFEVDALDHHQTNEVGFTKAWDGFRGALWKDRSPATEKPLAAFLEHDAIKGIYLFGAKNPELISPDNWQSDSGFMQRPNARRVQLDLFYDYRKNVELYPKWQAFLKQRQPRTIIFWGQNDVFFTPEGGEAFLKDLPGAEMHRLQAGHFAVEDSLHEIAEGMHRFYRDKVATSKEVKR